MTLDVLIARRRTPERSFLSALFDIGRFDADDLLNDYMVETQLTASLNQLTDAMPYPILRDKIRCIAEETAGHAETLKAILQEDGVPLPSEPPPESSPSHPSEIVSAVHDNAVKIRERLARYTALRRTVPTTLRPLIENIRDEKEHHVADIRDVTIRIVR
jgi:hypothetical protein